MTMAYDEVGSGPLAVCLPWFGTSRAMTRAAFEPALLSGGGLRVLYPDLPGHGDSPVLDEATSEAVLAEVVRFIELHAYEPVLLCGCSYGGYLAAAIARRRPELVRGLLLVCPGVRRDRDLPESTPLPSEAAWLEGAPPELHDHFIRALGNRTAGVVRAVAAGLAAGGPGHDEFQDKLQSGGDYFFADDDAGQVYQGPVALVAGRQDGIVGFADQFRVMSRYPHGTFVVADSAGHYLPYERPDVLRSVAADWLERCGVSQAVGW